MDYIFVDRLSHDRFVTERDKRGGWERSSFDRVNAKTQNFNERGEGNVPFDNVSS